MENVCSREIFLHACSLLPISPAIIKPSFHKHQDINRNGKSHVKCGNNDIYNYIANPRILYALRN